MAVPSIKKHKQIKAFCYINASWESYPDKSFNKDCRIQLNQDILNKYIAELDKDLYIHSRKKE